MRMSQTLDAHLFLGKVKSVLPDVRSDFLIGLAEGDTFKDQGVHLLHAEYGFIFRIAENILVQFYVLQHQVSHIQALVHLLGGRKDHILQKLEIPVVTMWKIGG